MKLEMRFSEANSSFGPQFDEGKQAFGVSVGEVMMMHDGQSGGGDTLFVTVDYDTMTASHTPAEMAEHIANGGKVFVALDGEFAAISACNAEMAAVVLIIPDVEGGTVVGVLTVDADKTVSTVEMGGGGGGITVDDELNPNSTNPVQNKAICEAFFRFGTEAGDAYDFARSAIALADKTAERVTTQEEELDALDKKVDGLTTNQDFLDAVVAAFPKYNGEVETV